MVIWREVSVGVTGVQWKYGIFIVIHVCKCIFFLKVTFVSRGVYVHFFFFFSNVQCLQKFVLTLLQEYLFLFVKFSKIK